MNPLLLDIILRNREKENYKQYERDEARRGGRRGNYRSNRGRDRAMTGQTSQSGMQGGQSSQGGSMGSQGGQMQGGDRNYEQDSRRGTNYSRDRDYQQDGRQGMKGTGRYGQGGSQYYPSRDRAMQAEGEFEYDDRDYDYDSRHNEEQNQYDNMGLNRSEFKKWRKMLKNADGTRGEKYERSQIMPIAEKMGVDFREYNDEDLVMAVNAMYSDYCKIFGNDLHKYVELAKAFLEDDDFDGTGSEKLALYYHCIANKDEE